MSRRTERYHQDEDLNIFQAFTDLMSNAFMIISFLLLLSLLQSISMAKKLKSAEPIIIDEKSGNFKFPSGSAELTPDLKKHIQTTILPAVKQATIGGNIDFIQAIGHTDGEGINNTSNLDGRLSSVATGKENNTILKAGSNADLGLMRAVAVIQYLKQSKGLEKVQFRAYSAAQLYLPSGQLAPIDGGADDTRRRIEIRFIPHGQKK
jgi:outer membrane protein OmpA-like peptidoglycan-associated protein